MDWFDDIFARARRMRLHPAEGAAFRGRLIAMMRAEGGRSREEAPERSHPSPYAGRFFSGRRVLRVLAVALVALVALGGGVTGASAQALPGGTLYDVKVRIVEEIASAVRVTASAKALYDTVRIERRLEEAEGLARERRDDPEAWKEVTEHLSEHLDSFSIRMDSLGERNAVGAADAASNLEALLETHEPFLLGAASSTELAVIAEIVAAEEDEAEAFRALSYESLLQAENPAAFETSAEEKEDAAGDALAEAEEGAVSVDDASTTAILLDDLAQAGNLLAEGKVQLKAKMYAEAFILFDSAEYVALRTLKRIQLGDVLGTASVWGNSESTTAPGPPETATTSGGVEVPFEDVSSPHISEEEEGGESANGAEAGRDINLPEAPTPAETS